MRALPLLVLAACASQPPAGTLRFANQDPVWQVADRTPLPKEPAEREYFRTLYHIDGFAVRRATRAMDMPDPVRAADVNALDEVPDSTWFVNRIGVRDLAVEEIRRGPNVDPSPFDHRPWTITGAKVGGTALGFVFEDARGEKYLLKFDVANVPEMETGAHMIGHRLVWAMGYNVPQDFLGYIRRQDLVISPEATKKSAGKKTPLLATDVDEALAKMYRTGDGRFRVLASKYLPGKPIGPYAREGVRKDDPNDRIPHERRRSLRGQIAPFSWLNHTDMQEDNTLDAFVRHPGPDGKKSDHGHVVHYLIDFGKALGVMGYVNYWKTIGYTYRFDIGMAARSLVTLGLWKRPWDDISAPQIVGIGLFSAEGFDPGRWRANSQYWPYEDADRFDGFWGAKLVMRFTRAHIEAAVAEAQFSDPRASQHMIEVLLERQRRIGAYWFAQVSPLDRFEVRERRLCFDDLALVYGLESARDRRVIVEAFDGDGRRLTPRTATSAAANRCIDVPASGATDGYTIVKLASLRGRKSLPPVLVHLARDARGELRVSGIRRQ